MLVEELLDLRNFHNDVYWNDSQHHFCAPDLYKREVMSGILSRAGTYIFAETCHERRPDY